MLLINTIIHTIHIIKYANTVVRTYTKVEKVQRK